MLREMGSLRAHIFVDCENINTEMFKQAYVKLKKRYEIVKCDLYGKESVMPKFYKSYTGKIFERHNCFFGKNSADTFMCTAMTKACYEEILTVCFIIFTNVRGKPLVSTMGMDSVSFISIINNLHCII
jgi:hypothetical protein